MAARNVDVLDVLDSPALHVPPNCTLNKNTRSTVINSRDSFHSSTVLQYTAVTCITYAHTPHTCIYFCPWFSVIFFRLLFTFVAKCSWRRIIHICCCRWCSDAVVVIIRTTLKWKKKGPKKNHSLWLSFTRFEPWVYHSVLPVRYTILKKNRVMEFIFSNILCSTVFNAESNRWYFSPFEWKL